MSKPTTISMTFKDKDGYLCAVRVDSCTLEEATEIAKKQLVNDNVKQTDEYKYMYFGFGKAIGDDSYENTWWITDEANSKAIPVYVFREVWD